MESGDGRDKLKNEDTSSGRYSEKLDEVSAVLKPPVIADEGASLGPFTPNPKRENGDFPCDLHSPLSSVSTPPKLVCFGSRSEDSEDMLGSPQTPKEGVFDPFAPGPEEMALAPFCKKHLPASCITVIRRLDFDSSATDSAEDENSIPEIPVEDGNIGYAEENLSDEEMEEILFESVYGSILESIISKRKEDFLAEAPDLNSDGFKTPPSAPRLNGIAKTCPDAPKPPKKLLTKLRKNIDMAGLCRKLEF